MIFCVDIMNVIYYALVNRFLSIYMNSYDTLTMFSIIKVLERNDGQKDEDEFE